MPQVRGDIDFYPSALEKGLRSERALKLALAEMYVKGISTRKHARAVSTALPKRREPRLAARYRKRA